MRSQSIWADLTRSRQDPVSFGLLSYAMVGAVMFLLGRASGLSTPAEPLLQVSPVVTALESVTAAPAASETRPSSTRPSSSRPALDSDAAPPMATPSRSSMPATPLLNAGPPFRGSLVVSSSPRGAQVFVNGVAVGTTPLTLGNLAVGSRALRLVQDGYEPWYSTVQIVANQRARAVAELKALRRQR